MINYDNVLYNIVKTHLKNDTESIDNLRDIIDDLSNDNLNIDVKVEKLYSYFSKLGIDILNISLDVNDELENFTTTLFENEPFKSGTLLPIDTITMLSPQSKLICYILKFKSLKIDKDLLYAVEVTDINNIKSFINKLNNIILLKSILNILTFIITNNLYPMYSKLLENKNYDELKLPLDIYNILTNNEYLNTVSSENYIEIYKQILSFIDGSFKEDDTDKEFLKYYSENVSNLGDNLLVTGDSIVTNLSKEKLKLEEFNDIFKQKELDVKAFLLKVTTLDSITEEQYNKWNELLTAIINKLIGNEGVKQNVIESVKQSLNKDISIIVDLKGSVLNKNLRTIFTDMSTQPGLGVLNAKDGEKTIGDFIIDEYNELLLNSSIKVNITNDDNSFFKSLLNLLSDDDEKINEFFNWIDDKSKLNDCYTTLITLLENKKVWPHLSSYYTIMYIKFMLTN